VGSIPTASTNFSLEIEGSASTEHKLNSSSASGGLIPPIKPVPLKAHSCELRTVKVPFEVKHKHLVARVIYAPSDGLYHASFALASKRIKRAAKTPESAESRILEAMKLAGQGQMNIAAMTGSNLERLNTAVAVLGAEGFNDPLAVINEYINLKRMAEGADIPAAINFYKGSFRSIKRVPFSEAADCWLKSRKARWAVDTLKEKRKRVRNVVDVFRIDACDITYEALELFFVSLNHLHPKSRNHFREVMRGILNYCVDRSWLDRDVRQRLDSLLKNEFAPGAAPQIFTPLQYRLILANADPELLPMMVIGGLTGARPAEIRRLRWENIWDRVRSVEVEAKQAKKRSRRLVERLPALESWLEPYRLKRGLIWAKSEGCYNKCYGKLKSSLGICIDGKNLLRHSFGSYRLAMLENVGKVSLEMGNSAEMVFSSYRELVERSAAEEWFSIYPENNKNKIIKMA